MKKLIRGRSGGRLRFRIAKTRRFCGRRTGLFYLAKEARRGELPIYGLDGWGGSGSVWTPVSIGLWVTLLVAIDLVRSAKPCLSC